MSNFLSRVQFRRDHRWAPEHMSAYLEGELAAKARSRIERHVSKCEECRRVLAGLRGMLNALHGLPAPGGSVGPRRIATSVRLRLGEPPERE